MLMLGCTAAPTRSVTTPAQDEWPRGAPPRAHYARLYEGDEANQRVQTKAEYYRWIVRFYEGWPMFPTGWRDTETQLLEGVDEEHYAIITAKLSYLGHLISGEWAKDNGVRRIHSSTLMVWGALLRDAHEDAGKERAIDHVTEDVLGLLSGTLSADAIDRERYQNLSAHDTLTQPVRSEAGSLRDARTPGG